MSNHESITSNTQGANGEHAPSEMLLANELANELAPILSASQRNALKEAGVAARTDKTMAEFDEMLDDVVFEWISKHRSEELAQILKGVRSQNEDVAKRAKIEREELFNEVKNRLLSELNVSEEDILSPLDKKRNEITELLESGEKANPGKFNPLMALGLLSIDQDGNKIFRYKRGLFADSTDQKWDDYCSAVVGHEMAADELMTGGGPDGQAAVIEKDRMRRAKHNAVAKEVEYIFGGRLSFDDARSLIAKMREQRYPNTGEEHRTNRGLAQEVRTLDAIRAHILEQSGMHSAAVDTLNNGRLYH